MRQLTGVLEKLATPELYERNPFFMLGLPVGASSKEIARRKEDIEAEIEMGNASTVFAHYGKVPDEFAIKDAFTALEDPEQKLLFGFFWFWPMQGQINYGVPTLQQLEEKDFSQLRSVWKAGTEAYDEDAMRARHNLAILSHFMAMLSENAKDTNAADSYWRESIEHWNQLADEDDFWFLVSDHVRKLEDPRLTTGAVRRLRQQLPIFFDQINVMYAEKYARAGDTKSAKRHREYMEISQPELDDIDGTTENAFVAFEDQVERLTEEARERARKHPKEGLKAVDDLLKGCRPAVDMAKAMALDGKEVGAALFRRIVQAVHTCLICYGNETRDWRTCLSYTTNAYEYAVTAEAKKILSDDEAALNQIIKNEKEEEKAGELLKMLEAAKKNAEQRPYSSLDDAERIISEFGSLLREIQGDADRGNSGSRELLTNIVVMLRWIVIQYANVSRDWAGVLSFTRGKLCPLAPTYDVRRMLNNDMITLETNNRLAPSHNSSNGCLIALLCGGGAVYGLFELIKASVRLFV